MYLSTWVGFAYYLMILGYLVLLARLSVRLYTEPPCLIWGSMVATGIVTLIIVHLTYTYHSGSKENRAKKK